MRARPLLCTLALGLATVAPAPSHAASATDVAGIPASLVGQHGPSENYLRNLELAGHSDITPPGSTLPAGNNGAPALVGSCAFVGRWHDYRLAQGTPQRGVQVIDVDPASPEYLGVVGEVKDSFVPGSTSREVRAVDLPNFKLLVLMTFSDNLTNRPNEKLNTIRMFDFPSGDCRAPRLVGMYDLLARRPHEFFLWLDPDRAHDVNGHPRMLVYISVPIEAPNLEVVDISDPALPRPVAVYDGALAGVANEPAAALDVYLHSMSVSVDGTRAYLSYWDGGILTVDTTALAAGLPGGAIVPRGLMSTPYDYSPPEYGATHSAVEIPGKDAVIVGDEVYTTTDGCPFGYLRVVDIGDETTAPRQIGEFRLPENRPENCDASTGRAKVLNSEGQQVDGTFSIHNQTVTPDYVVTSWYGGGMRVIDVSDPTKPFEVGAFVPKPLNAVQRKTTPVNTYGTGANAWWVQTWSYPIIRDGLIYVTDTRNGLYILRPSPGAPFAAEIAGIEFLEGNSNVGAVVPQTDARACHTSRL
jgi:hypothetical protein